MASSLLLSVHMKTVIIVSKCLRVIKLNRSEIWYQFHFKGVFAGESLGKVLLKCHKEPHPQKNEEYLIYVRLLSVERGVLKGEILRIKNLEDCWDRS